MVQCKVRGDASRPQRSSAGRTGQQAALVCLELREEVVNLVQALLHLRFKVGRAVADLGRARRPAAQRQEWAPLSTPTAGDPLRIHANHPALQL